MLTNSSESSGTRSQKGCWTCKLRRKKCDENHPICETCGSLGIACEGYGPRPDWMDRGPLERETAEKVKMAVARNGHRRSRSRWTMSSLSPSAKRSLKDKTAATKDLPHGMTVHAPLSSQDSQENSSLPTPSEEGFTTDLAADILSWQNPISPGTDDIGIFTLSPSTIFSPKDFAVNNFSLPEDFLIRPDVGQPANIEPTALFGAEDQGSLATDESHITPIERPSRQLVNVGSHTRQSSISEDSQVSSVSFAPSGLSSYYSGASSTENALFLSYYMSKVIYTQFSFGLMSEPEATQWLQFVLFGSKHVLETSMVLSKAHYTCATNLGETEYASRYEDDISKVTGICNMLPSPTNTMCLFDEERRIAQVIATCTSLVQNIHLEVGPSAIFNSALVLTLIQIFYGGSIRWRDCLREAAPYLQTLIDLTVSTNKPRITTGTLSDEVLHLQFTAAKALLGKVIWFDVLATVSTGKGPFLGINHTLFFNSYDIDMVGTSGCHNAVVTSISETVTLQHWKTQTEREGRLSVIELVTRGGAIAESLNNLISGLTHATITTRTAIAATTLHGDLSSKKANKPSKEMARDITLVYARAALVYLHFVLSGSNPDVEEIRRGTMELMESLKVLSGSRMVGYALWPLCVAACAARGEEEERALFQTIELEEQDLRRVHPRTYQSVREIGRECRRLRFMEGGKSCWTRAMDRLQKHILLA